MNQARKSSNLEEEIAQETSSLFSALSPRPAPKSAKLKGGKVARPKKCEDFVTSRLCSFFNKGGSTTATRSIEGDLFHFCQLSTKLLLLN